MRERSWSWERSTAVHRLVWCRGGSGGCTWDITGPGFWGGGEGYDDSGDGIGGGGSLGGGGRVGHERFGKRGLGETSKGETEEANCTVSPRRTIRVSPSVGGTGVGGVRSYSIVDRYERRPPSSVLRERQWRPLTRSPTVSPPLRPASDSGYHPPRCSFRNRNSRRAVVGESRSVTYGFT